MPRTQYIFIDYENVSVSDLSRAAGKNVRVILLTGTQHKKLPVSLFLFAQENPGVLKIIQTPVQGTNALDLVLSLEAGRALAADPTGYIHIISKDNDFESVIRHLQSETRLVARHPSLEEVPALRTPEERIARLRSELTDPSKSRPATRKTLENKILSAFDQQATPEFIEKTISTFIKTGLLDFTDTGKVLYSSAA